MNKVKPNVTIRTSEPQDYDFIISSWLKGYRHSPQTRDIRSTIYFKYQHKIVENLLDESFIFVACNPEDSDHIYGYLVGEHYQKNADVIHWVYVKGPFRRMGIGTALFKAFNNGSKVFYTHNVHDYRLSDHFPHTQDKQNETEIYYYLKSRKAETRFLKKIRATYNPYFAFKETKEEGLKC